MQFHVYKYANNYLLNTYYELKSSFKMYVFIYNYVCSINIGVLKKSELEFKKMYDKRILINYYVTNTNRK